MEKEVKIMFENAVIVKELPEKIFTGDTFSKLESQFVNAISKNKLSIAETRYLFNCILNRFEKDMPVTNHSK